MKQKTTMGLMMTMIMANMMIIQLTMDHKVMPSEYTIMYDWLGI